MMFQPVSNFTTLNRPTNVIEVVELLYSDMSLRDKTIMADLSEHELDISVYLETAKIIRKEFGLYSGNGELLHSCQSYMGREYDEFEDPAMIIVKELWRKVRKKHRLRLVH